MKNKLMSSENVRRIYKSLNMSNNKMTNCEVVDGTSNKVDNKILTPQTVHSKRYPLLKKKQSKVDQILRKVKEKKLHMQKLIKKG